VILFRANNHSYVRRTGDLEVPPLTPPDVWLREVAELLRSGTNIEAAKLSQAS